MTEFNFSNEYVLELQKTIIELSQDLEDRATAIYNLTDQLALAVKRNKELEYDIEIGKRFYKLAITERDAERARIEILERKVETLLNLSKNI